MKKLSELKGKWKSLSPENKRYISIVGIAVILSLGYIYRGEIMNNIIDRDGWYDYTEEYIARPDYPLFTKYNWATWRDSVGGRMAHDPNWFKLPADKYIPKEVPFDWDKMKGKTAIEKRAEYFNHLCSCYNFWV